MTKNGVELAKKVTIYGVAILTMMALSGALSSFGMRLIVIPKIQEVMAEERQARQHADEVILQSVAQNTQAIAKVSLDRIKLLAIMEQRNQQDRIRLLEQFRRELDSR